MILTGELFKVFEKPEKFPVLPKQFEHGHYQYKQMWEYLYAYEVYNSLLMNKRDVCQDMKINGAGLEKGQY